MSIRDTSEYNYDEFGNLLNSAERHELIDQKIKEREFKKEQ